MSASMGRPIRASARNALLVLSGLVLVACSDWDALRARRCLDGAGLCDGVCTDLAASPLHCGTCGRACGGDEECVEGACVARCEGERCAEACVDPTRDPAHCGGCGRACAEDEVCAAGSCASGCSDGATACDGSCVDLTREDARCGDCDTACGEGLRCVEGACTTPCPAECATSDAPACAFCAPRAIWPLSGRVVHTDMPPLRFEARGSHVTIELSQRADLADATRTTTTDRVVRPSLAPGIWYWRLRAAPDGTREGDASPVWSFRVEPSPDGAIASRTELDVDRDGLAEVFVGGGSQARLVRGRTVVEGGPIVDDPLPVPDDGVTRSFADAVALAGDLDGDGHVDLAIGQPTPAEGEGPCAGTTAPGRVCFVSLARGAMRCASAGTCGDRLGDALAGLGDLDGDGYADVGIGAPGVGMGCPSGDALVAYGRADFFDAEPELRRVPDVARTLQLETGYPLADAYVLGHTVAGGLDLDGDGRDELAIGAPHLGAGCGARPVSIGAVVLVRGDAARAMDTQLVWTGDDSRPRFGRALAFALFGGPRLLVGREGRSAAGRVESIAWTGSEWQLDELALDVLNAAGDWSFPNASLAVHDEALVVGRPFDDGQRGTLVRCTVREPAESPAAWAFDTAPIAGGPSGGARGDSLAFVGDVDGRPGIDLVVAQPGRDDPSLAASLLIVDAEGRVDSVRGEWRGVVVAR